MALDAEKRRAVMAARKSIEKKYGNEVIYDTSIVKTYEVISTGSAVIDDAIGIKPLSGFPRGRIVEIYGPEASGKTSICMSAVAQAQKQYPDLMVLYIDTEQAFDLNYAKKFGVNVEQDVFMFVQPDSAEQSLQIMREMASTGAFSLIVLDSVAAMATDAQLGKNAEEKTMGSLAGVLSPELAKIKTVLGKTNTTGIFINQIREKVSSYGGGETTPGGRSLPYYASLRIRVSKTDVITNGKDVIGQELKIDFKKNKVGTPFRVVTTKLIFGQGFDFESEFVSIAESKGIIKRGGAWYSWVGMDGNEKEPLKFQGAVRAAQFLKTNPEEFAYIKKLCDQANASDVELLPEAERDLDDDGSED